MKTVYRPSSRSFIPEFSQNAVLQLIIAAGTCFVTYHLSRVILLVAEADPNIFPTYFTQNIALPSIQNFHNKFWTIITYGWIHNGFWELFSNMVWLYCFGSMVQMLVGYKQIIPLFFYSLIVGGVFYELGQLIPNNAYGVTAAVGAQAGVTALAVAVLTLSPDYRVYLGDRFSIPLVLIAVIFFALVLMNTGLQLPRIAMLIGGAAMGFAYVKLLKNGYRPGGWIYDISDRMSDIATPKESSYNKGAKRKQMMNSIHEKKQTSTQRRIDDILDKINQNGYDSLTKEEREILLKASKEDNN